MDLNFTCTDSISPELFPSRHVTVLNVGPDAPVPADIAYALRPLPPSVPVVDPFFIDAGAQAREAREAEAYLAEARKPPHSYTSAEAAALLGLDLLGLTECIDHMGAPKPRVAHMSNGTLGGPLTPFHLFDGRSFDAWLERVSRLFGPRKAVR